MKHILDWVDQHRILAISGLNSMILLTLTVLVGVVASEEKISQAETLASPSSEAPSEDTDTAPPPERRIRRKREAAPTRGSSQRSAYQPGSSDAMEGQPASGSAREPVETRRSSFRARSARTRVNWRGAPPPRDIESASHYGPWHAQQQGEDALAELPPDHPLAGK